VELVDLLKIWQGKCNNPCAKRLLYQLMTALVLIDDRNMSLDRHYCPNQDFTAALSK
jgi:hypothetical protein